VNISRTVISAIFSASVAISGLANATQTEDSPTPEKIDAVRAQSKEVLYYLGRGRAEYGFRVVLGGKAEFELYTPSIVKLFEISVSCNELDSKSYIDEKLQEFLEWANNEAQQKTIMQGWSKFVGIAQKHCAKL